ncbi:MAG: hypothetical protein REI78_15240 [Pedobacter sp.]|nr:hypothetical protein [Pedobacter sp.]MDQ8054385.1 hypothetical protein [Pedobacter sp.]
MKMLVFGPSGAGKSYVCRRLKQQGIPAFDEGDIEGLSAWYNKDGQKIEPPTTADEAIKNGYAFLWSKKVLRNFIKDFDDVWVFGGSGNIFNLLDLFDQVYFLQVAADVQLQRLKSPGRPTPLLDFNQDGTVIWGAWLEAEAKKRGIEMTDPETLVRILNPD